MTFSLTFETDNAAFDGFEATETCRILRDVARRIEGGDLDGPVRDANGNRVGGYALGGGGGVAAALTQPDLDILRTALADRGQAILRTASGPQDAVSNEAAAALRLTAAKINAASGRIA